MNMTAEVLPVMLRFVKVTRWQIRVIYQVRVAANASISGTGDVVVDILVEEPTDVVIGFVCTITVKQGRAKIDNFKLELVERKL